jgi:hypothetical protein
MSKVRYVNTRFWSDDFIVNLDYTERYLFLYFLTNEHTNLLGIYELPLKRMSQETGIEMDMLKMVITRLNPKVEYFGSWVWVRNFSRFQVAQGGDNVRLGVERERRELPSWLLAKIKEKEEGEGTPSPPPPQAEGLLYYTQTELNCTQTELRPRPIGERRATFVAPTPQEVKDYCQERGNQVDPQRFVDFYASKGWMVGKNKMRDWKASVRGWEARKEKGGFSPARKTNVTII